MIIIIPLGGIGSRFKKNGYNKPKALIKIFGKPILFWLIESLNIKKNNIIYILNLLVYKQYLTNDFLVKVISTGKLLEARVNLKKDYFNKLQ